MRATQEVIVGAILPCCFCFYILFIHLHIFHFLNTTADRACEML